MGDPKSNDLAVRINVVGHASPRWKSAKNRTEADILNQRLSENRAQNVQRAVEEILKRELPGLPIVVPAKGVGSKEGFPTVPERGAIDNAGIDRSVIVTVDLAVTRRTIESRPSGPARVYMPSKLWTLKVISMFRGAGLGYVQVFLRVSLGNPNTGKNIILSGWLAGGGAAMDVKDSFKIDTDQPDLGGQIGDEVAFHTKEALTFDEWSSVLARLEKVEASFIVKASLTQLKFTNVETDPDTLAFDRSIGVGLISADGFLVAGRLTREGPNPGDYLELPGKDNIWIHPTDHHYYGLLLSFPTGKADLKDLTENDRKLLRDFVTNKARAIAALSESFNKSAPHP